MGSLTTNSDELKEKLAHAATYVGGCPSPLDCYFSLRGLKSLEARM